MSSYLNQRRRPSEQEPSQSYLSQRRRLSEQEPSQSYLSQHRRLSEQEPSQSSLSQRRRLSEQELSLPRYQWRSRGNSMSEQEPSQPRYDWRSRVYGSAASEDTRTSAVSEEPRKRRGDEARAVTKYGGGGGVSGESFKSEADRRREKYKRTHSEGGSKMRVRFSTDLEVSQEAGEYSKTEHDNLERKGDERRAAFRARGSASTLSLTPSLSPSHPDCGAEGGWGRRHRSDTWRSSGSQESYSFLWSSAASSSSIGLSDSFNDSFSFDDEKGSPNLSPPKDSADCHYNDCSSVDPRGSSTTGISQHVEPQAVMGPSAMNKTPQESDQNISMVSEEAVLQNVRGATSSAGESSDLCPTDSKAEENGIDESAELGNTISVGKADERGVDCISQVELEQPQGAISTSERESYFNLSKDEISEGAKCMNSEPELLSNYEIDDYISESRNQALDAAMSEPGEVANIAVSQEQEEFNSSVHKNDSDEKDFEKLQDEINVMVGQDDIYRGIAGASATESNGECKIGRMIEQMMLEEQSQGTMKDDGQASMGILRASVDLMSQDDIESLRQEARDLQNVVSECNEEMAHDEVVVGGREFRPFQLFPRRRRYSSQCNEEQQITPCKLDKKDDDYDDDTWRYLPVVLLEDVFTLLSPKERHQASMVCREWYDLFYSPRVWETFILLERTLTKKRFNLYKGYQRELCPGKTQLCFRRVGSYFKRIVVTPITDYNNLYEFLRILASYLQYEEDHGVMAMPLLHTFDFTFAPATRNYEGIMLHGTGGQILVMIKELLCRINELKHLKLNQLLLDVSESPGLFDSIAACFGESLLSLEALNVTKIPVAFPELSMFQNLLKLTVSPQHLNEEVLVLLAGLNLLHLHLVQDFYTCDCQPVSYEAWKLLREMAPWLKVYLELSGRTKSQLLIQPRAPVHGIFLRTPYSRITNDLVMSVVEYYSKTLNYFVQERLPRLHGPRGFESRCDSNLLFLVRRCPRLHSLVIAERLSTSTLILITNERPHLRTLLVRENALIKRCDWPKHGEWPRDFYERLRHAALDYGRCTDEVSRLLRRRWLPLTDKEFLRINICPKIELF